MQKIKHFDVKRRHGSFVEIKITTSLLNNIKQRSSSIKEEAARWSSSKKISLMKKQLDEEAERWDKGSLLENKKNKQQPDEIKKGNSLDETQLK